MAKASKSAKAANNTERKDSETGNEIASVKSSCKPLTAAEQQQLARCEAIIEKGIQSFLEVAEALLEVRDKELFRATHDTFQEYCADKWGITSRHANRLVLAGEVMNNIAGDQLVSDVPAASPKNEAQARELAVLTPEEQVEAAREVAKTTTNPTAKDFKDAAKKVAGKSRKQEPEIQADEPEEKPRVTSYAPDQPTEPPVKTGARPTAKANLERLVELVDAAQTQARKTPGCDDVAKTLGELAKAITRKLNGGGK